MVPPRVAAEVANIELDYSVPSRGVGLPEPPTDGAPNTSFIDKLWNDNRDLVNEFLQNELCRTCAQDYNSANPSSQKKAQDAFKSYSIQDYFYLEDWIKFRGLRINSIPQDEASTLQSEAEATGEAASYLKSQKDLLTTLKVTQTEIEKADRSVAELAYGSYVRANADSEDWFNLHVMMIPCVYGWCVIAKQLYQDPKTSKTGNFWEKWIKPNINTGAIDSKEKNNPNGLTGSAIRLAGFLETNKNKWAHQTAAIDEKKWTQLFRTSLRLEIGLFKSGLQP